MENISLKDKKFKWVNKIGLVIVNFIEIEIGGSIIDNINELIEIRNTCYLYKIKFIKIIDNYNYECAKMMYHNLFMIGVYNNVFLLDNYITITHLDIGMINFYKNIVLEILDKRMCILC